MFIDFSTSCGECTRGFTNQLPTHFCLCDTKFAPDTCFGLLKQKLRKAAVHSLEEIANAVKGSANVNVPQLVGTQDGKTIVPVFDWQVHLFPHFKKFPTIKKWHAFIATLDNKGRLSIKVKRYSNTPEIHVDILKDDLPSTCQPHGLSEDRKLYLYEKIRQYCSDAT